MNSIMYEYGLPIVSTNGRSRCFSNKQCNNDEEISKEEILGTYLLLQLIQKMQKTLMMRYQ
jgi:hypothetical protein